VSFSIIESLSVTSFFRKAGAKLLLFFWTAKFLSKKVQKSGCWHLLMLIFSWRTDASWEPSYL